MQVENRKPESRETLIAHDEKRAGVGERGIAAKVQIVTASRKVT